MVAINEHLQHSPRDTRLCKLMVMAIAQRKGHVWEAQSVAGCQIIVAWPTPRSPSRSSHWPNGDWIKANKRPGQRHLMVVHNVTKFRLGES